jgi:hypothetical protein
MNNKVKIIATVASVILVVIFVVSSSKYGVDLGTENSEKTSPKVLTVFQTMTTRYFEINIKKVTTSSTFHSGYQWFGNDGKSVYLTIWANVRNIDEQRRIAGTGTLAIVYKGKNYFYDQPETVDRDDLSRTYVNPLVAITAGITYKVPNDISGKIFWQPEYSDGSTIFSLGEINNGVVNAYAPREN